MGGKSHGGDMLKLPDWISSLFDKGSVRDTRPDTGDYGDDDGWRDEMEWRDMRRGRRAQIKVVRRAMGIGSFL
jgi:hypothetical protein